MNGRAIWMWIGLAIGGAAELQAQPGPSQASVDEAVRFGALATLAPLCGIREEAWGFDLRRVAILQATRTSRPDDPALKVAPGGDLVVGALSFAEAEALESFAEEIPEEACRKVARDPALNQADALVEFFHQLKSHIKPSS